MTEIGLDDSGTLQQLLAYACMLGILICLCAMRG